MPDVLKPQTLTHKNLNPETPHLVPGRKHLKRPNPKARKQQSLHANLYKPVSPRLRELLLTFAASPLIYSKPST